MLKRCRPDGHLADIPDSDIEDEIKEKVRNLRKLERDVRKLFIEDIIYNASKVQESVPLSKAKFEKEINEEEKYQQKQKQKQNK